MQSLVQEMTYAVRMLRKTPGFTAVALLTTALGIGANTALFSVVHAVLLRALPFEDPERLYRIWTRHSSTDRYPFQLPEFCDYRDQNRTLQALAGFANWSGTVTGDGPAERLPGLRVTGNFFEVLGTRAVLGRTLRPSDDTPGSEKAVVLSYGLWQRRFGSDPNILGRSLTLNGESFSVAGVLGRDFLFPTRGIELAIPLAPESDGWRHNRDSINFMGAIGRARTGASRAQITDDLDRIARGLRTEFPTSYARKLGAWAVPYREELTRNFSQALWVLMASVALLLLIACANLANLMLVRAAERRRELAIRLALGASRWRLLRQLLIESALLALAGGALGVLLAYWSVPALVAGSPASLPRAQEVQIDLPVLLFTLGAALLAGLGFGLLPALRAARLDPNPDLRAEGRGAAGSADRGRLRGLIITGQVATMVVLLAGAGLLLRSFREVMRVEPGFETRVLSARLSLPRKDYPDLQRISRFYRELEARVTALPGVTSVAAVNQLPLNGAVASADYKVEGRPPASESQLPTALYRMATPAYFRTLGIPVIAGRGFDDDDRAGGAPVAIVSQALARQSFEGRDPIGQHLLVNDSPRGFRSLEIVGVVGDVKHASLEVSPEPHLYVPYHQVHPELVVWLAANQFLVVRSAGVPLAPAEAIRRELHAVEPNVAMADLRTTGDYVEAASASRRFNLELFAGFAVLALAMAAVGIYGVVSYTVAQRTPEIGLRIAMGARIGDILRLVIGEGMRRSTAGIVIGLVVALGANRALQSLLYRVTATDPASYAAAVALLAGVTLGACLLPAWRAAGIDPLAALRGE